MSVDIEIYIDRHLDKRDIEEIVYSLGFKKEEFEDTYLWFDNNYISTRGCHFGFAYDVESFYGDDRKIIKTVCSTSTYAGRSYNDFQMQIDVIRKIEEVFGGVVYSDGEIGYYENDITNLSRTEIACGFAYITFERNLFMVKQLIEEVNLEEVSKFKEMRIPPIYQKNFLRNNTLIPFLVSIMESFLKTFFHNYISSNQEAENLIFKKKDKLAYNVVKELLNNEKTIFEIETEFYSFQNFYSANKAYSQYVKIDLFKDILSHEMVVDDLKISMSSVLDELLGIRHKVIHDAILDYSLGKEKMEKYYNCLILLKETFKSVFEEKKNIRIDLENEL